MDLFPIVKIFTLTAASFVVTILWTPALTHFLYKYKLGKQIRDAAETPVYSRLHAKKSGTPTMGGVLIWGTTLGMAVILAALAAWVDGFWDKFSFLTRRETLLPLGALVASALVGLVDDYYNVRRLGAHGGGLRVRHRLFIYTAIAAVGAWWFFYKLDWDLIRLPFVGDFNLGWWFIPLSVAIMVATSFSVNETDGLDGLAGGTLLTSFGAYGAIAFSQGRFDLAAFCGVIIGALLAFLWFNIPPARFFMGDTGAMSLGVTLGIVALLTNSLLLLPVIGLIFVIESLSVLIQTASKKLRGKKIFISTPIHHHFEAIGWPESKIVMRFWVISGVSAVVGVILSLLDRG
ncbi:phospho-N-acetylmuramoyl-pentapeptide-transferase [Candidatus Uhrbacteria bacterium RIFCSPHIGHO2_12_FULL_57_11]|uniref:Phospho-N-acetylmuramoyl-pentapeptide-transferase n=1 Tax=Candidatus Uhrbacteria bacterium RIFCSPHIGHO2_12_FULL_57_11 TaxID=1802398 RepID=A0A1F7ULW1_9BACT|nr:MAG: phospho-N-acetylmuramoyl-pentapeptide-transferase [Candidatus Uhrbacteria bacterium RIFCSPHIGHO2_12_FULL_57_11]